MQNRALKTGAGQSIAVDRYRSFPLHKARFQHHDQRELNCV